MEIAYLLIGVLVFLILGYFLFGRKKEDSRVKYGDYDGRIKKYSIRIEFDPNDMLAYYERGLAYLKSNKRDLAKADLEKAGLLGHPKAYDVMESQKLNGEYKIHFTQSRHNYTDELDMVKSHEYKGALSDYDKVIKSNPNNSVAYFMRADIKEVYNDHLGAIDDLTNAIKFNHKYREAFFKRGVIKYKLNDFYEAKKDLEISLKLGFEKARKYLTKIELATRKNSKELHT